MNGNYILRTCIADENFKNYFLTSPVTLLNLLLCSILSSFHGLMSLTCTDLYLNVLFIFHFIHFCLVILCSFLSSLFIRLSWQNCCFFNVMLGIDYVFYFWAIFTAWTMTLFYLSIYFHNTRFFFISFPPLLSLFAGFDCAFVSCMFLFFIFFFTFCFIKFSVLGLRPLYLFFPYYMCSLLSVRLITIFCVVSIYFFDLLLHIYNIILTLFCSYAGFWLTPAQKNNLVNTFLIISE